MQRMYNPPHPGEVLCEFLRGAYISAAAKHLRVPRVTLSRILNGAAGISADMSLRLSEALGTHPAFWYDMQGSYDMWQARKRRRVKIERFEIAA